MSWNLVPKPAIALEWLYESGEIKVLYYGNMEECGIFLYSSMLP